MRTVPSTAARIFPPHSTYNPFTTTTALALGGQNINPFDLITVGYIDYRPRKSDRKKKERFNHNFPHLAQMICMIYAHFIT